MPRKRSCMKVDMGWPVKFVYTCRWNKKEKETDMEKEKQNNNTMSKKKISDEQLEEVNGGMKIETIKSPKEIEPLLRFIFKIKKDQDNYSTPPSD